MGNLTLASWAILTTHALWFASLAVEMSSFWAMRRKLKIHARSPMLAVVSGFGGSYMQLVIMLFELFAQEGITIPCTFMLYSNVIFMTFYPLPYLLRGLRVVIVSDKVWRAKYSTVLSRRNVFLMLFAAFIVFTGIAVMLQFVSQNIYGPNPTKVCFAIADWWLYGPVCMICAGISSKLFLELSRVQDRINMSKEISSAAIAWLVTSVPFYLAFILNDFGVLVAPRPVNFLVSICVFLTGLSTFFIEPRRSKGVIHIFGHHKKKIAVVMDEPQIMAWKEKWHDSRVIMSYPPLDHAFEKHVQDYLCSESYDFLKELDKYIEKSGNMEPEKQFEHFREIINIYIMPGSELEVNIETSMRNKILKIGEHDDFIAAEVTMKRDIFNPSGTEIRKMLDENLLKTFLVSPAFLNVCKHLEEEAGEAESSISTMVDANELESTPLVLLDDKMREEDVEESEMVISLAKASLHFN